MLRNIWFKYIRLFYLKDTSVTYTTKLKHRHQTERDIKGYITQTKNINSLGQQNSQLHLLQHKSSILNLRLKRVRDSIEMTRCNYRVGNMFARSVSRVINAHWPRHESRVVQANEISTTTAIPLPRVVPSPHHVPTLLSLILIIHSCGYSCHELWRLADCLIYLH